MKKTSYEDTFPNVIDITDDDKEDEAVRRDRIEKYKEERRLALRQKYRLEDKINDKKDEEMIRRFKQKILKNEKADTRNVLEFDSSLNTDVASKEHFVAKETYDKSPTAVTTISILYTSRKKRNSAEEDNQKQKCIEEKNLSSNFGVCSTMNKSSEEKMATYETKTAGHEQNSKFDSSLSKSFNSVVEQSHECPLKCRNVEGKRPFTSSLERKVKSFVREESLVAKRVNQLSGACESESLTSKRNGEVGFVIN